MSVSVLFAQTAFPSFGGDASSYAGSLSYTVGQLETHYDYHVNDGDLSDNASLVEGVQQTFVEDELEIEVAFPADFSVSLYPNPTSTGIVTLEMRDEAANANYEVYSASGQLLQGGTIAASKHRLDLRGCAAGTYLLRVFDRNTARVHSYRIIKVR